MTPSSVVLVATAIVTASLMPSTPVSTSCPPDVGWVGLIGLVGLDSGKRLSKRRQRTPARGPTRIEHYDPSGDFASTVPVRITFSTDRRPYAP